MVLRWKSGISSPVLPCSALFLIVQLEERWWEDTWMENELDSFLQRELGKKINPKSPKNILSLKCFQNKWDQSSEQCTAMDKLKAFRKGDNWDNSWMLYNESWVSCTGTGFVNGLQRLAWLTTSHLFSSLHISMKKKIYFSQCVNTYLWKEQT